jgi:hypothetical protein
VGAKRKKLNQTNDLKPVKKLRIAKLAKNGYKNFASVKKSLFRT